MRAARSAATARARVYRKDVATGAVDLASVGVNLDPRSLIAEPLGTMPRRRARIVAGTADDDSAVVRVDVALSRRVGHGRCLWLAPRSRVVKGTCAKPVWVASALDGGLRFTLAIRHILPRGTWSLRTRATDETGGQEPARPGLNLVSLKLL